MELQDYLAQVDRIYEACPNSAVLEDRLAALLEQCGQEHGRDSIPYASLLGELGGFYRGQGRWFESEMQFRQALALLGEKLGENSPEYATTLNNLAGVHRLQGRQEDAFAEFRACLELYQAAVGENHVLYAAGLNNLSLVHLDRQEWEEALALQERAADILMAQPQAREEFASALCNQGALYERLGKLDEAEAKLNKALSIFQEELGTDTPHYYTALNTLGIVHYTAGRFQAACDYFDQAARAAEKLYGPDHHEVQMILAHRARAEKMEEIP